jgi:phosphoribosylaminoimidazolecarboxamide formyltransferase/IMP cyclohydrolase
VLEEMAANQGAVSRETNYGLAVKVFQHTAAYDGAISNYLGAWLGGTVEEYPATRSGEEGPRSPLWREPAAVRRILCGKGNCRTVRIQLPRQLQGKELSFNNIIDLTQQSRR